MPIEILPEGYPDWIEYSTTDGVLFLGLDPFWKTKTGKTNPGYAIMYRGGQGFLDQSIDGGRAWTSILPSTQPSWFGDDSWQDYYYGERPYGMPSSEFPPATAQLEYTAYSPNHVNSGEHYVLTTWTLTDGGGISPSEFDVHICWILYTTDDWATHKWSMVRPYVYRETSTVTNDTPTTLSYSDADKPEVYASRLSDTKVALWTEGSGVPEGVYILTESGGAITEEDFTSGAVNDIMFNYEGDYLYWGATYLDRVDGGVNIYRARVYEWDVTGTTPSLNTYQSGDLTSLGIGSQTAIGWTWHLTDDGRLCWIYRVKEGGAATDSVEWTLFYFDVNAQTFSSETTYYFDQQDSVPYDIELCAMTVDGTNKMIVIEAQEWDWTGKGASDWKLYEFMWVAGTWSKSDETNFYNYVGSVYEWHITPAAVSELSGDRVCFWITRWFISGGTGIAEARIYTYDTALNTITYDQNPNGAWPATVPLDGDNVSSIDARDLLHVIGYNKMDNPIPTDLVWIRLIGNRSGSVSDRMYYFDPTGTYPFSSYLVYSSDVEYDIVCLLTGYNVDGSATMIHAPWVLNGAYTIDVDVATVAERGPDHVISKLPSGAVGHQLSSSLDGTLIYVATSEWQDSADDNLIDCKLEYMTREPDAQSGIVDFPTSKAGWHWKFYASGFTKANHDANAQYISLFPWEKETDGVLVYGLPWAIEYPNDPDQLFGESPTAGQWYYWGANLFTDPVRAVLTYGSKVYALLETSTALELWVQKAVLNDAGADMQLIADTTLNDASVGLIADVDTRDGAIVVSGNAADPIVVGAVSPYTSWSDITLSHRVDKNVTGLVILL